MGHRLTRLQDLLPTQTLDGFLVPRSDEHQGEYVAAYAERLNWLTGFSGSAGFAVIMTDSAHLFVDGRYTLQAAQEVDEDVICIHQIEKFSEWLEGQVSPGKRIGFDPWLHTHADIAQLRKAAKRQGIQLVPVTHNMVDQIWTDQPEKPRDPVVVHPLKYAGQTSEEKLKTLKTTLETERCDATVVALPDSVSWLLNIRGTDIPMTPSVLGYCLVTQDTKVKLFLDPKKITQEVQSTLGENIEIVPWEKIPEVFSALTDKNVFVDFNYVPYAMTEILKDAGAHLVSGQDIVLSLKACKNQTEREGARNAHLRDGVAVTQFLAWITQNYDQGVTELMAVEKLLAFRQQQSLFQYPSFDTISGFGSNGAIVHYRVNEGSSQTLESGNLYLVDSGGQYLDGTTDVTRTIALGTPTAEHRDRYTRVLKGHMNLGKARFPQGTKGPQLDAIARYHLWQGGFDYAHGTGHGVGSYLNVHEGPQRITQGGNDIPLKPGMIVSNEPGYYKNGAYGIRIENLIMVTPLSPVEGGETPMMEFENLTKVPLCRALIDVTLLEDIELEWINRYQSEVYTTLKDRVDTQTASWLCEETQPLEKA